MKSSHLCREHLCFSDAIYGRCLNMHHVTVEDTTAIVVAVVMKRECDFMVFSLCVSDKILCLCTLARSDVIMRH